MLIHIYAKWNHAINHQPCKIKSITYLMISNAVIGLGVYVWSKKKYVLPKAPSSKSKS